MQIIPTCLVKTIKPEYIPQYCAKLNMRLTNLSISGTLSHEDKILYTQDFSFYEIKKYLQSTTSIGRDPKRELMIQSGKRKKAFIIIPYEEEDIEIPISISYQDQTYLINSSAVYKWRKIIEDIYNLSQDQIEELKSEDIIYTFNTVKELTIGLQLKGIL